MRISGHASPQVVLVASFTSTALAIITVALRLWTRLTIVRQPGWDDWLSAVALIFLIVFTTCVGLEVRYGLGYHFETLTPSDLNNLLLSLWISVWNYYIGLGLAKLSIVIQCMRIFGHIPRFRIASYALGSVIVVFMIFSAFISIFLCWPIPYFWHPESEGHCIPRLPLWLFNSAFTMLTDMLVTLLPIPCVRQLQLPPRQKNLLLALFGIGGLICIVSIARLAGIYATTVARDISWENSLAALYSNVELAVGIIVGCVPTLKAFCWKYFPGLGGRTPQDATPLSDLSSSGRRTIGGGGGGGRMRMDDWRSEEGKKSAGVSTMEVVQHSIDIDAVEPRLASPPKRLGKGEINVTTVVEQVERRRDQLLRDEGSNEGMNPVTPFERP